MLLNPVQSIFPVLTEVQESESYLTNEKVIAQAELIDAVKTTPPRRVVLRAAERARR